MYYRVPCPGKVSEVEAAALRWNEVLRAFFQLDDIFSSVVDALVRWGWSVSKAFAKALNLVDPYLIWSLALSDALA